MLFSVNSISATTKDLVNKNILVLLQEMYDDTLSFTKLIIRF